MSEYNSLKATIAANIKRNGNQEITGEVLQGVLTEMVTWLGRGYQYISVATPAVNPGNADVRQMWFAFTAGTYPNFGGLTLAAGESAIFVYDTDWTMTKLPFVTAATLAATLLDYQEKLVSGTNIKTVAGTSVLGSGNIAVPTQSAFDALTGVVNTKASAASVTALEGRVEDLEADDILLEELVSDLEERVAALENKPSGDVTIPEANLLSSQLTSAAADNEFVSRVSPAVCDGLASVKSIKGNSVVWNQLAKVDNQTFNKNGITIVVSNNKATISGTATADVTRGSFLSGGNIIMIPNHKYLNPMPRPMFVQDAVGATYQGFTSYGILTFSKEQINNGRIALTATSGETISMSFGIGLCDLTQMFGAGNEPSTYAEFLQRKPKVEDEYAYDAGTPINFVAEKVKLTGKNLFSKTNTIDGMALGSSGTPYKADGFYYSEKISLPDGGYINSANVSWINIYDADNRSIAQITKGAIPQGAKYARVTGYIATKDIAMLYYGEESIAFEPYKEYEFNCNPKEVKDAAMGVIEDMSTLGWTLQSPSIWYANLPEMIATANVKLICSAPYTRREDVYSSWGSADKCFGTRSGYTRVYFKNTTYTDTEAFIASMQGVSLAYELANPSTYEGEHPSFFPYGLCKAGSAYDEITPDYAVKRIGVVKLKDISWSRYSGVFYGNLASKAARLGSYATLPSALKTGKFTTINASSSMTCNNLEIYEYAHNTDSHRIVCKDESCQDVAAFLSAHGEDDLFYELATPVILPHAERKMYYPAIKGGTETIVATRPSYNLWDEVAERGSISLADGSLIDAAQIRSKNFTAVTAGKSYTISTPSSANFGVYIVWYTANKTYITSEAINAKNARITAPANAAFAKFYCSGGYGTTYNHDLCFTDANISGKYEAYGETYEGSSAPAIFNEGFPLDLKSLF